MERGKKRQEEARQEEDTATLWRLAHICKATFPLATLTLLHSNIYIYIYIYIEDRTIQEQQ